jgi:uncharacterized membrane protein
MAKKKISKSKNLNLTNHEQTELEQQLIHLMQASYQGPLPPASQFEKYEKALPGASDRILRMAEKANDTTSWILKGELILKYFGLMLIACITLGAIIASAYVILKGYVWAGLGVIIVPVVGAIAAAIRNRSK